jgi:aryl-alcohol dehydrogenase-like predicted oxidoreductase
VIGLGCMRLSTEPDRDETRAIAVLHSAFDAGVTFLDTADAYCWDDSEAGHNERLIAHAIATWSGDRTRIQVATKGGLTRPQGNWIANGRARHLTAACAASMRALGVTRLHLYQLHAADPRTPLSTSVRALASLRRDGLVERIGLCNVTVQQIEEASRIVDIDAVQVEVSLWQDASILGGVVRHCIDRNVQLIAYRPLGGSQHRRRIESNPILREIAARHHATPAEIAIAWLADLSAVIVPIPGATTADSARSIGGVPRIALTDDDRSRLDEHFPAGRALRRSPGAQPARKPGEVVIVMGLPGAGKTTVAEQFVARDYMRFNRDVDGGSLKSLLRSLDMAMAGGETRIVVDNTYVSRKSRAEVIHLASRHGLTVRCVWLSTTIEDAQVNAVSRIIARHGRLLSPEEMRIAVKDDISAFGPSVPFRYQRELEPPDGSEGFSQVDVVAFERRRNPAFTNRALIVWCDGVVTPERAPVLRRYAADGWRVLGLGWQPGIADQTQTVAQADATYADLQRHIGVSMDILYCPHGGGPPICWCRKPLPGLGVVFIERYLLDAAQCIYVGNGPQDPGFARRLGFQYQDAREFFA